MTVHETDSTPHRASHWGEQVLRTREPALVARTDRDGWPIVYATPAFARHLGLRVATLLGRSLWSIDHPAPEAASCVESAVRAGEEVTCVLRLVASGGPPRWCEATFRPLRGERGDVTHVLVTHVELTRAPVAA